VYAKGAVDGRSESCELAPHRRDLLFGAIVLAHLKGYGLFDERFTFLFNAYHETLRRGCRVLDAG
jgi:hypothetical protein